MYKHKLIQPQSNLIKYRGNTGQIDKKDTVINILSKNPGLIGARIADMIFDKEHFSRSHSSIYETLADLCREHKIVRNGNQYYLIGDAISHDMAVTERTASQLDKMGVSLEQARFLSSGLIMAGEAAIAESRGQNFNIDETVAAGVAAAPKIEEEFTIIVGYPANNGIEDSDFDDYIVDALRKDNGDWHVTGGKDEVLEWANDYGLGSDDYEEVTSPDELSQSEVDTQIEENTEYQLPEGLDLDDPFTSLGDEDREALKDEANRLIAESYEREEAEKQAAIEAEKKEQLKAKLSNITEARDLLGATVEINPGQYEGQVVGTILELRPTGVTFLITFSSDDKVQEGSVLPLEYASGVSYKILVDFDVDNE